MQLVCPIIQKKKKKKVCVKWMDIRPGGKLQSNWWFSFVSFLNRNTSEWRLGISGHESFWFWELLLICVWIQVQSWVIPSAPLPPVTFHAASFFPATHYSRARLCSPQAVKTACDFLGKRRTCSEHRTAMQPMVAMSFGEVAQDKVWDSWSIITARLSDRSS